MFDHLSRTSDDLDSLPRTPASDARLRAMRSQVRKALDCPDPQWCSELVHATRRLSAEELDRVERLEFSRAE